MRTTTCDGHPRAAADLWRNLVARILIAEDDPDLCLLLRLVVSRAGHEVVGVEDGVAALQRIRGGDIDLVVLDNQMPRMTGLEVLGECSDMDAESKPIFLMLTALATRKDIRAAYVAGVDDFLAKPFSREELVDRIQQLLDEAALEGSLAASPGRPLGRGL
ncbi:response regulator [Nocardioides bruguierae]|uniref:Response regulator n=1 Tax=Nocardioides bruguierae TaxID=2945102 RepID=A0A9X2DB34_9ACTN|nr:response regulator [Nocardioides bruguierae]MCM0622647.1 response regulator [Nocardioides bruguierae]